LSLHLIIIWESVEGGYHWPSYIWIAQIMVPSLWWDYDITKGTRSQFYLF